MLGVSCDEMKPCELLGSVASVEWGGSSEETLLVLGLVAWESPSVASWLSACSSPSPLTFESPFSVTFSASLSSISTFSALDPPSPPDSAPSTFDLGSLGLAALDWRWERIS
jgi:hypothetical protein